ncbi:hypothetical protein AAG570_005567 [Ranatra chinensis]|uniref:Transcription factor IIIB 90 kDa subunit n=1 Tax=Ranatra chinensis TaxID=642074 RepID=A0ABD0XXT7_9HEMI
MTALRLVQRMKKDSMHSGRRPSGICGAALLMASRLHGYSRTVEDIIKVVQIHKSTLKKRLVEFGETPSSSLTLQEFMTVDLEEEQDPPSYKLARAKDRERLKTLEGDCIKQFTDLQSEIETKLFVSRKRKHSLTSLEEKEEVDTEKFVAQSTLGIVGEYIGPDSTILAAVPEGAGKGPSIASMGLGEGVPMIPVADSFKYPADGDLDTEGINDDEIDSYIMDQSETDLKDSMWHSMNADYLQAQKEKEERLKKEKEEGKPEKKKRRGGGRKKGNAPANSAGEAIEKMLQEKKISAKINYDVLKSLSMSLKEEELES